MSNNLHLTLDERNIIEQELMRNTSFRDIALILDKDPTTIAKEVRNHRIRKEGQSIHVNFNHCSRKFNCKRRNVCGLSCNRECRKCNICNKVCNDFEEGTCLRLKRAPYVCNGCINRYNCRMTKYYYRALSSYKTYRTKLAEARQGINMSELELSNLDKIISPLVKQGQSISHIYKTHDINCSRSTLYKYVANNCFSIGPLDLPRKVRLKKRNLKRKILRLELIVHIKIFKNILRKIQNSQLSKWIQSKGLKVVEFYLLCFLEVQD